MSLIAHMTVALTCTWGWKHQVEDIAQKIYEWSIASHAARPPSGHLVTCVTENNTTDWTDVGNPFL